MRFLGYEIVKTASAGPDSPDSGLSDSAIHAAFAALAEDIALLRRDVNRIERKVYRGKAGEEAAGEITAVEAAAGKHSGNPPPDLASLLSNLKPGDPIPPGYLGGF